MKNMLGNEYAAFLDEFSKPDKNIGIRINTLKPNAEAAVCAQIGECERIPWCENGFYVTKEIIDGNHPYHSAGLFYFQEPSAMSAVEALDIHPGDYVLDLCAAPGGKATQAAAATRGCGLLVANEPIPKRAAILAENIERLGITNAVVTNETPDRLEKPFEGFFDKIIVDAPCSGEGMFRKEPQAAEHWSPEHVSSCAQRQKNILASAVKMLKPGGCMVYSTCTFAPEENEENVLFVLDNFPELLLCEIRLAGLCPANGAWAGSGRDLSAAKRFFPHRQKGEGHFIALFKKSGEAVSTSPAVRVTENSSFLQFEKEFLNTHLSGDLRLFGDNLYLVPCGISLDKIKVVRAGLHLGILKKNRFEPSHALAKALACTDFKYCVELNDDELKKYMHGETLPTDVSGWAAVTYGGYAIGWAKGSGGILKNHYPKHLRI